MEIERKFLVAEQPELSEAECTRIEQGYLALADAPGGAEVRLRRRDDDLSLTVKSGDGRIRAEQELALDHDQFEALWPLTEGRRVRKLRCVIAHGELEIELDRYEGALEGLLIAEVEFDDEDTAEAFEAPTWFGAEVTGDRRYLNVTLATEGDPR